MAAPHKKIPPMSEKRIKKFWARIDRSSGGCWLHTNVRKYGEVRFGKYIIRMNRVAFFLETSQDPGELQVLHSCDNPRCVNPKHLFLGTQLDNIRDRDAKSRTAKSARHGTKTHPNSVPRGEQHRRAKLSQGDVLEIRLLGKAGIRESHLARQFRVSRRNIRSIISRATWKHLPSD